MPETQIAFFYDSAMLEHQPYPGHPERPERLRQTLAVLEKTWLLKRLKHRQIVPATLEQMARVHDRSYLVRAERIAASGGGLLDAGDTVASAGSWRAATMAAGAAIGAVDAVMRREAEASFALVRPPGHHATPHGAMGFCIVNNAAVAAAHARDAYGLSRILIVDFDVHHGNGTQDAFYDDPEVLYFSTHQYPAYPGTGSLTETGAGLGAGFTVNVPMPAYVGDAGFIQAFETILRPVAARFRPELVLVSAGYDAHWRNSAYVNGIHERMTVAGLAELSRILQEIANCHCPGKLAGILEGGYDLEALAYGVCGTLSTWLGDAEIDDPIGPPPAGHALDPDITELLERVKQAHEM